MSYVTMSLDIDFEDLVHECSYTEQGDLMEILIDNIPHDIILDKLLDEMDLDTAYEMIMDRR